jgi:hypothetical protein
MIGPISKFLGEIFVALLLPISDVDVNNQQIERKRIPKESPNQQN